MNNEHGNGTTTAEKYMKMLKYAHNSIDDSRHAMAQKFLDEAKDIYNVLEEEACFLYHLER